METPGKLCASVLDHLLYLNINAMMSLHLRATEEPASFLSFLSTLFNHSTHQSLTKRLSVGINVWRALSIDDFMFVPVFLLPGSESFSNFFHSLNPSPFQKEKDFEFDH